MNLGHSQRFAGRLARQAVGDFYPGPRLMPHAVLHAMDPLLVFAFSTVPQGGDELAASTEAMLRGRPDGPMMLALWGSVRTGEIPHQDLRELLELMQCSWPDCPKNRGELLAWLMPRASAIGRCLLSIAGHRSDDAIAPAERLGVGLALTWALARLPAFVRAGRFPFPLSDLEKCGLSIEELQQGVRTPAIDRFLATEARWANEMLDQGLGLNRHLGARLRRGLRAAVVRARRILDQVDDPRNDIFRRPPRLAWLTRWYCAWRGLIGVKPRP